MNLIALLMTPFVLSAAALALPCKMRVDLEMSKWDDRTINAVVGGLDTIQPKVPHVSLGLVFPRSGSNIRWTLNISETGYAWSRKSGHVVKANVTFQSQDGGSSQTVASSAASKKSYEAAVAKLVESAILNSGVEAKASALSCESVVQPAIAVKPVVEISKVTPIRAMCANISSGNKQSYDEGEGIRIFKGLKPDVVMIQEFNYKSNSEKDLSEMIMTAFDKAFSFYRESESTDQIPNGIISRFSIIKSGEWTDNGMPNRDFAWAKLDIPGDKKLWAISVHLSSSKPLVRLQEVRDLKKLITENIPDQDYVLLGGDFNIAGRDDATIRELADVMFEKEAPTDSEGKTQTNKNRNKNYDWVLTDKDLAPFQVPTRFKISAEEADVIGENVFPHGLVFDSRNFPKLDRVGPVLKEDSNANNMQHMAVVKDFELPAPSAGVQP